MQDEQDKILEELTTSEYKYGFVTDIETEVIPVGLNEDVVRLISKKKNEPEWLLDYRLKAFAYWKTLETPTWAHLNIPEIDYQSISYYAAPKKKRRSQKFGRSGPRTAENIRQAGHPLART